MKPDVDRSFALSSSLCVLDISPRPLPPPRDITVSFHGVCVFPAQDLTPDELSSLALALGKASGAPPDSSLHIHPTAELGENGRPTVGAISNVAGAMGRQINFKDERSELASQGIHSDIVSRAAGL